MTISSRREKLTQRVIITWMMWFGLCGIKTGLTLLFEGAFFVAGAGWAGNFPANGQVAM